jgi:hypothetical protein
MQIGEVPNLSNLSAYALLERGLMDLDIGIVLIMSTELNEEKKIVFNTPKNLNVAKEFPEFSNKDLPKIECLVNQINYMDNGRGYQVHIKKHAWSYCLSNGEVGLILKRLVSLGIIKKAGDNTPGLVSNAYQMVQRYTNDNSNKSYYQVSDYLFMQKLQADKWVAMGKERSKYVKPQKADDPELLKAQSRIKELEALLTENGISIPAPINNLFMAKPCVAITEEVFEPVSVPVLSIVPDVKPEAAPNDGESIRLSDHLTITHFDNMLVIQSDDESCYINNHNEMAGWVANMDIADQIRLYSTLVKEPGVGITVPIKGKVKAQFLKMPDGEFTKVTYKQWLAA